MATYTIELRSLIQRGYQIFDDSWTTFDPEHKAELCNKIIRHYWFYEIGCETADRFKWNLNEQLALIMPYYNQLYASELLKLEPLYDRYLEEREGVDRTLTRRKQRAGRMDVNSLREMAESIKRLTDTTENVVGNEKMQGNEQWTEDRTINTTETTDQDTTENTVKKVNTKEDVTGTSHEVMNDVNEGSRVTDGTSNTVTSSERRFSDTPQGFVSASGVNIENNYLTEYTRESGSSDTTTHENQTIKNTEDKTTDTNTTKNTVGTEDTTQDVTGTNDITKTIKTTDNVVGDKDKSHTIDDTEDTTAHTQEKGFSNGSVNDRSSQLSSTAEDEDTKDGTSRTTLLKGWNISQSELLEAYRRTFLNIDQMIIRELAENFMGIF